MSVIDFLDELPNSHDEPLKYASLAFLSGISSDEARVLAAEWAKWPAERVRELFAKLYSMADEDPLLEFECVFQHGLEARDPQARVIAIRGLAESTDRSLIGPFCRMMLEDESDEVRETAARGVATLAQLASEGKTTPRERGRVRAALLTVLNNREETVAVWRRALEAIGPFPAADTERFILEAYASGRDELRQSAIYAMGRSSDARWLPKVIEDLRDPRPAIRHDAVMAIGELGDEQEAACLADAIEDEDTRVRIAAAEALGKLGGATALELLRNAVDDEHFTVASAAEEALQTLQTEEALFGDDGDPLGIVPRAPGDAGDGEYDELLAAKLDEDGYYRPDGDEHPREEAGYYGAGDDDEENYFEDFGSS